MFNFYKLGSWYDLEYRSKSGERFFTFRLALNLFLQRGKPYIVETGCVRMKDDYGAGYSTYIFGEVCQKYNRKLFSVDLVPHHLSLCKEITQGFVNFISYNLGDSIQFLANFKEWDKVGLLYLDSLDTPIDGSDVLPSQQHHLNEFLSVEDKIQSGTVLLLDDNQAIGQDGVLIDGKPKLLKEYLSLKSEWECLLDYQQSVWQRR